MSRITGCLVGCLLLLTVGAVPAAGQEEGGESEPERIGLETCAGCHEQAETFPQGSHGRAMERWDPDLLARSCDTCHEAGEDHVLDPMPENVNRIPADGACLSCHAEKEGQMALATPDHARRAEVGCLDCHDEGHDAPDTEHLLAATPVKVCGDCHGSKRAAAHRPFAHRDGDEPFPCTSCHSVHGETRTGRLLAEGSVACIECHTEKTGPFVFPHPPREVEGCPACHQPHGSTNPRMLTRRSIPDLCIECHPGIPAFHDLTQSRFRACVSCHTAVHGSNRDVLL
ncbi:MAG: cytochrome c3 family protein, partial [Thermoanaerobaculia bacterium]|nr:cytochrome c3 family protein [Thermoanaerobaculia bacterium]